MEEMKTGKEYRPIYNIVEIDIEPGTTNDLLTMTLQERYWNGSVFMEYRKEQHYNVNLPKYKWKGTGMVNKTNLPEGVTKHAVRVKLINNGRADEIIKKLAPGFYDVSIPKYYNVMRFLEKVRQDGTWCELWSEMAN